jgi:hypothetical protein
VIGVVGVRELKEIVAGVTDDSVDSDDDQVEVILGVDS